MKSTAITPAANSPADFALTVTTTAKGALFNNKQSDQSETAPAMLGNIQLGGKQISLSGFLKNSQQSPISYLSLSLGDENGVHYYGKLFRNSEKSSMKSSDYTGFITILPCIKDGQHDPEDWNSADTLKVTGWKKRNGDGSARIALTIASHIVADGELNF